MSRPAKLVAAAAAWAIWAPAPACADPTIQTLEPSRPSTPALDEQFLGDITNAGIRIADVRTAVAGGHDTCAYLAAGHDALEALEQGLLITRRWPAPMKSPISTRLSTSTVRGTSR
jgi:hypothetical protein